jgi:hypothetical protein
VVVVNDEDVVALDQMMVVNLSKNVVDHQDVETSFQMDQVYDVVASFYTYVDVVVVNYHHDVDYNVVALSQVDLTFDDVDSYSKKKQVKKKLFYSFYCLKYSYLKVHMLLLMWW